MFDFADSSFRTSSLDGQIEKKSKTNFTFEDGLYDVTTEAILKTSDVGDPTKIDCIFQVGNYSRSARTEEKGLLALDFL